MALVRIGGLQSVEADTVIEVVYEAYESKGPSVYTSEGGSRRVCYAGDYAVTPGSGEEAKMIAMDELIALINAAKTKCKCAS